VRRFKSGLGRNILHHRTLRSAVAYNVAMWNRIAEEIDGSRSIEELAGNLIGPELWERPAISPTAERPARREERAVFVEEDSRLAHYNLRAPLGLGAAAILILSMAAVPGLTSEDSEFILRDREELASVSPFLEHGRQFERNEEGYFVGELGRTWDFVATNDRKSEAIAIGAHFASLGTEHVTLLGPNRVIEALYEDDRLKILLPRPARDLPDKEVSLQPKPRE